MRIRREYSVRELAGEHVVVVPAPEGAGLTRILALNASALYLWEELQERDFSPEEAAQLLVARYDVAPDVACDDARQWIERLTDCGIIEP